MDTNKDVEMVRMRTAWSLQFCCSDFFTHFPRGKKERIDLHSLLLPSSCYPTACWLPSLLFLPFSLAPYLAASAWLTLNRQHFLHQLTAIEKKLVCSWPLRTKKSIQKRPSSRCFRWNSAVPSNCRR